MPKTKSQIPQGSFALLNKCNGKGEQAIYLRYFAGKYVKRSTDIWILPEDWDKAKQEVKPRNRNAARINNRLADIKQKVDAQLIAYSEGVLSPEVVLRMMDGSFVPEDQRAKRTLFIDYAKDVNEARDVMECKALSYELRQQALLQIIEYYMTNYDGDILEKYLLQVDLKYLDKLHSAEIISGYIMRNMNRKAYEVIKLFGYQGVELPRLLRLASFVVTDTDIIGDEALTALCIYLYQKGQYNDRIISYLVFHYKSCTKELSRLWETAIVVLGEARELEENLLAQLIFADARLDNEVDIFTTYYNGRHRGMVTKAYLKRMAYKSFILEEWVSDRMYEYLLLEMKQGEIQDDICSCAILQHYAKLARLHEDEQAVVAKLVKQFLNRGIVLPFFKHFVEYVELPQEVFLKTYLVYKGEERQDVIVNYSVGTSELQTLDFKPCRMEERIPGYYVQEFVVFHGEQLLYHFSEEYQGHVEMIESDSIRNDVYLQDRPSSRFERLNQMLIDQELRDDESLTEEMERYMKNQHVFEEIMRMV